MLTYHLQLLLARWHRLLAIFRQPHFPPCLILDLFYRCAGVIGREQRFARLFVEGEDGQRGNQRGGSAPGQADSPAPGYSGGAVFIGIAVAGAGDVIDLLAQAMAVVLHDDSEPLRERGYIGATAAAGEARFGMLSNHR